MIPLIVTALSILHLSACSIQLPERNDLRFKRQFDGFNQPSNNGGFDWNSDGIQNGGMIWNGDSLLPTNDFIQNQNIPNPIWNGAPQFRPRPPPQNGNNNNNGGQFLPNGNIHNIPNWNGDSFLPNNPNSNSNLPMPSSSSSSTPNPFSTTTIAIPGMGTTRSACEDRCQVTSQYNPVCGDNNVTYTNMQWLICAQRCGRRVNLKLTRACPTTA